MGLPVKPENHNTQTNPFSIENFNPTPGLATETTNELNIQQRLKNLLQELEEQKNRMAQEREEHRFNLERRDLELKKHRKNSVDFETQKLALIADMRALSIERDHLASELTIKDNEIQHLHKIIDQKTRYATTRQNALESINTRIDSLHASIEEKEHIIDFQNRELARLA